MASRRSDFSRHVPTQEEGIARAREATKRWLKDRPEDAQHWTERPATPQAASSEVEPLIVKPPFSTTLFNCKFANPVAQVWECVDYEGGTKQGRTAAQGWVQPAQPKAATIHLPGQCAVLLTSMEPFREADGSVKVFRNWGEAYEAANQAYHLADEEDSFPWTDDHPLVYQTERVQVLFDPQGRGNYREPFILWLYTLKVPRPVYAQRTRPMKQGRAKTIDPTTNPQAAIDQIQRRARHREINREPTFEERAQTFRNIKIAIEKAHYWDDYMSGRIGAGRWRSWPTMSSAATIRSMCRSSATATGGGCDPRSRYHPPPRQRPRQEPRTVVRTQQGIAPGRGR
jgi:hypothetical protein